MVLKDIRYALRQLRKAPGFTLIVVVMLALGIGANTAVFSVMNAILMQLLPVSQPEGLSYVRMPEGEGQPPGAINTGAWNTSFSEAAYEALRQRKDVFGDLMAYVPLSFGGGVAVRHGALSAGSLPEVAEGEEVSGNFFSGLGARIALGRGFTPADEREHAPVVVLSYGYWTRSFARNPEVLGRTLYVKGVPMTVVGVTARGFEGVEPAVATDFWIPMQNSPELTPWGQPYAKGGGGDINDPKWWCLRMMARLRPGVSAVQAQQALEGTFSEVAKQAVGSYDPQKWKPLLDFVPARGIAGYNQQYREPVQILMGLVGLVLLIACTNVAMMVQARNSVREREFSLRLAIGAGRGAIFRQLLCESLLLVAAAAALGWLFADSATRMLAAWSGIETGLSPDRTVLLFTLAISALAALAFGLVPMWRATHAPIAGVLHSTTTSVTGGRRRALGGRIVLAAQVAVCLVLLMAASLLLGTLHNYAAQNLGMNDPEGLLVFGVTPQGHVDTHAFYRSLLDGLGQAPGVEAVSMAANRPGSGWSSNNDLVVDGVAKRGVVLRSNGVGSGFFHTMGIPILEGRDIANSDTEATQRVAVVNETFVKKYLVGTYPLGHVLGVMGSAKQQAVIVGVVRDSKYTSVSEKPMPMAYYAWMQQPTLGTMNIEVRARGDATTVLPEMRKIVASLYPNVPLEKPLTQQEQFDDSYEYSRMFAAMGGFFGVLAALLVATGLYGSYSFRVSRRTTEIGVRMALGASRREVLAMVMRESLWVLAAGLAAGVPLVYFAAQPLKSMLYQMSPLDPASFVLAIAAMVAVAACATLVPARRAAAIEPMQALRME